MESTDQLVSQSSLYNEVKKAVQCTEDLSPDAVRFPQDTQGGNTFASNTQCYRFSDICAAETYHWVSQPNIRLTDAFAQDSIHFLKRLKSVEMGPEVILVRFDVVSLFTRFFCGRPWITSICFNRISQLSFTMYWQRCTSNRMDVSMDRLWAALWVR